MEQITAINFNYNKSKNILIASGNVVIEDTINNNKIYSDKITYLKNDELIFTDGNSKTISKDVIIIADKFEYNKLLNIFNANGKVIIENKVENYFIFSDNVTYNKIQKFFLQKKIQK